MDTINSGKLYRYRYTKSRNSEDTDHSIKIVNITNIPKQLFQQI